MGFHLAGIWVIVLLLLPNVTFAFLPTQNVPTQLRPTSMILTIIEQTGRVACTALPIVFGKQIAEQDLNFIVVLMGASLLLYYVRWIRFFIKGREYVQLFKPLGFIPVPMAVFPALYFIFLGVWLESFIFLIPALMFSIGHLEASWKIYLQIR
ncbi:hypothetical protein J2T13_002559 [Paenibacillus sp. DS2015]|uniref:hypothetical protein n=1 Tax=Paenibacillus sp. DS2015 TaxID=3373917 RepID=UPI003D20A8D5